MSIPVRVDPAITAHVTRAGFRLAADHPLFMQDCHVCDEPLRDAGVSLVYVGRYPDDDRRGWTAVAVAVHDACTDVPPEVSP